MDGKSSLSPKSATHEPRTASHEPRTTSHGFARPAKWFAVAFALALLAAAVKHAEEGQLFSAEVAWKAVLLCAVGALVQAIGALLAAFRQRR